MAMRISALVFSFVLFASVAFAAGDIKVEKYDIEVPEKFHVPYDGPFKDAMPGGFPIGIGSGMTYIGMGKDGARYFYAIGDRGPNANAPKLEADGGKPKKTKMFPAPEYNPSYGALRLKDGKCTIASRIKIKNTKGVAISGRPIPLGSIGATGETGLDDSLKVIPFDVDGMDTEGIAIDKKDKNYLWICDEYGPFIAKIEANTGRIVNKYAPGNGLPMIVAKRQPNRGIEGIAVTPSNMVLGAVQSICDVDGNVKKSMATFCRLVFLDPETGKTQMFAYPHDVALYPNSKEAKIGDLHAITDTKFLLIEQGKKKDKKMRNVVYVIDIAGATDITDMKTVDGKELETIDSKETLENMGIQYVKKTMLFDLRDFGWTPGKAEGVALLPNMRTIAVTSDNDFGFKGYVKDPAMKDGKPVKKAASYTVNNAGEVKYKGDNVETTFPIKPNNEAGQLWLVTMPKNVLDY